MQLTTLSTDIAAKQANRLIESIYKMDVNEHKLLLLATRKVNELELRNEPFSERTRIVITAAEFAKQYGISRPSAFEIIVNAKDTIYDREFTYLHVEGDKIIPMRSRWLQARQEDKGKSEISFMFASAVIPLIYLVETEYTMLDLHEVGKLKSKYAVRLYKHLMRWVNAPYKNKISLEKLREIYGLDDTEYSAMRDFKKRVLDISVKQVAAGTAFKDLTYSVEKVGAKITHVSFHYTKYSNKNIKNTAKVLEGEAKPAQDYVIYQMTDSQIKTFATTIAKKASKLETGFYDISQMVEPGQSDNALYEKIVDDFVNGNFEPYYSVLQLLDFKPNLFNRTPYKAVNQAIDNSGSDGAENKEKAPQSAGELQIDGDNNEDCEGGEIIEGESKTVYTEFSENDISSYQVYAKRKNALSLDQILELSNEKQIPPGQVIAGLILKRA